ncbi:MAG TPA: universal stress protein, partial [Myxococcota bacterium]|nr:universal stress protein [Myxococcota bacterium]
RVLMCVSFDRSGPGMITFAAALVDRASARDRLFALRLVPPTDRGSFYIGTEREPSGGAAAALVPLLRKAEELNVAVKPLSFVSAEPAHDICNVADVKQADLVLLGWHKPLLSQTVLGGTVYEVMKQARSDVAVLVDRGLDRIKRILVPFYGGRHDLAAIGLARRLVQWAGADATILHVVSPRRAASEAPLGMKESVEQVFTEGPERDQHVTLKVVQHDSPALAALEESTKGYDLLLVGVGPEWGLEERQFGLQPEYFIKECPTSLVVVRHYDAADEAAATASPAASGKRDAASNPAPASPKGEPEPALPVAAHGRTKR